jgi:hypothetical protein
LKNVLILTTALDKNAASVAAGVSSMLRGRAIQTCFPAEDLARLNALGESQGLLEYQNQQIDMAIVLAEMERFFEQRKFCGRNPLPFLA